MASFNHHPYLADVLTSLQKQQMHIETTSAGIRAEHPEHQQLFLELPWKNETQEWAELVKQTKAVDTGFFSRVADTFMVDGKASSSYAWEDDTTQMKQALRLAGENVPYDEIVETNSSPPPETTNSAAATSSTTNTNDTLELPGNGKPIVGPRILPNAEGKNNRATCSMFSF